MPDSFAAFVDDPALQDDVLLYRRVDWDKVGGRERAAHGQAARINANCFSDYPLEEAEQLGYPGPCMSVGVGSILIQQDVDPTVMLGNFPDYGLTATRVGDLRRLQKADGAPCPQGIMLAPTATELWHGVVFDASTRPRKGAVKKAIVRVSAWTVPLVG